MRSTTSIATLAAAAVLAATAMVAVAGPAAAADEGSQIPGNSLWFTTVGPLSAQSAATQVTSGSNAVNRPFVGQTTDVACPAGTLQMDSAVRVPQAGVPEDQWIQIPVTSSTVLQDADGRFYTDNNENGQVDRLDKVDILAYQVAHPGANQYPYITVCRDADAISLGYFRNLLTITGTTGPTLAWSIDSPAVTGGTPQQVATTTTLSAAGAGADLALTAAVTPAGAAGQVTFKDGGTTLGTAAVSGGTATWTVTAPTIGSHAYTAAFAPTDAAAYGASSGSTTVAVGVNATGQIVVTVPAAPVVDGALTFSVPFDTPVSLVGTRDSANTRVTASGAFPTVTVTDTRRDGLLSAWEVNAQATEFTGTAGTVAAKYLGWTPATSFVADVGSPLLTQAGGAVPSFLDDTSSAGLGSSALLGKAATPGRGVATLNAGLALAIPASTTQGTYTSTVTVTLVSN